MTLSENGIPHISYSFVDYADSVRGVRYAYQNGDSWIVKTVWQENRIPTNYLSQTYIELDRNGFPVVFFEANDDPGSARDTAYIFLARFDGQNWLLDTVDYRSGGDEGYNNFSAYSLKIDNFNRAHIFYQFDVSVVYGVQSGDTWRFEYLPGNAVGLCWGDMVLGGNNPRVAYSSVMRALTYGWRNENGDWEIEYILPNCPGLFPSIAIDSEGGIYVSFQKDDITGPLYYGRRIITAIEEERARPIYKSGLPKELFLTISSPVSAFSNIRLSYGVPKDERVQLAVYDLSGRTIMVLKDEMKKAGYYSETFNLSRLSDGIYWLVLKSGGETGTRKLVLIK